MAGHAIDEEEIKKEIKAFTDRYKDGSSVKSAEFNEFKQELMPFHFTFYEKACNFCGNLITIKADKKKQEQLVEALETCHINTTPEGASAFAIMFPVAFIIVGVILSFLLTGLLMKGEGSIFFIGVFIILGIMMMMPLSTMPMIMANSWRLKASNQMVLSIFYIVSYMRHTSNLELAIKFTSDHLVPPLSIDLKKIIWNIETSKFDSIKESLEAYLNSWKKYNMEFVESMHLIQASLYEPSEKKRISSLEKSMSLILEATYEKMLHFAQDLKSPITMLHMMGVILPILGLVILPLAVSFLGGVKWYHISVLYNLFLPLIVWYFGKVILSTRPTGYGQADITEVNPELKKYTLLNINLFGKKEYTIDPKWVSLIIIIMFFLVGLSPLIMRAFTQESDFDIVIARKGGDDALFATVNAEKVENVKFSLLGYKKNKAGEPDGPFGLGSTLLSIAIPFGLAFGLSFYYDSVTKKLVAIREKTKQLEDEFASALFQLGNRVGDGLPAEIAFSKVAEITENSNSGKFFDMVTINISSLGMGVEDAIFDKRYGAINKFPSALIESSMKVFVESARKGPDIAAEALINISTYIKEMHRVDERLKDLMAEITSSMQSQINFLAPMIAGIVIGLTSMITTILLKLSGQIGTLSSETGSTGGGGVGIDGLFGDSIPTYYFQIVVGIYVVQITYLLTTMLNTIENGYDPLNEKHLLAMYYKKSGTLYSMIALVVIMIFNLIAAVVLNNTNIIP